MTDFTINAGMDREFVLIYKDVNNTVIDITNSSARLMVREALYKEAVISKVGEIAGTDGKITFNFIPSDTIDLVDSDKPLKEYIYDVEYTSPGLKKAIWVSGKCIIKKPVTR